MDEMRIVLCILGAMIGAGFASGRELMQFFSRYGRFSWILILIAGAAIMMLIFRVMKKGRKGMEHLFPAGKMKGPGQAVMFLLLAAAGGGMTAAAGELAALTIPLKHIRWVGMASTLTLCLYLSRHSIGALTHLGKILLPLFLLTNLLCMRLPVQERAMGALSIGEMLFAGVQVLGYAGMNVMLSAGILCRIGTACPKRGRCRSAAWAGGTIMGILLLGNLTLLPHGELEGEALPIVILLQHYGKEGYYLSAAVLYLAVVTTLIAVLQAMTEMMNRWTGYALPFVWLIMAFTGLIGFERIVAVAYPVLGLLCFLMILLPEKSGEVSAAYFGIKDGEE